MARQQREISVSEFFLKNRHLLGFDNPRKALLTTVKEAVDNALDACEEAHIVPEISVDIQQIAENRFKVSVTDNSNRTFPFCTIILPRLAAFARSTMTASATLPSTSTSLG